MDGRGRKRLSADSAAGLAARLAVGEVEPYRAGLPRLAGSGVCCVICAPVSLEGSGSGLQRSLPTPATQWDHCHVHGIIRGPLCGSCNSLMSKVDDGEPWFWEGSLRLDEEKYRQYRARCPRCPPGAPARSRRAVERDARVRLAARLSSARAREGRPMAAPCAWCPITQALHGVNPNQDRRYQNRTIRRWLLDSGYTITETAIR